MLGEFFVSVYPKGSEGHHPFTCSSAFSTETHSSPAVVANEEQPKTVLRKSVRLQGRQDSEKKEGEEDQKWEVGKTSKGKPMKGKIVSKPEGGTLSQSEKKEEQEEKASKKGEGTSIDHSEGFVLYVHNNSGHIDWSSKTLCTHTHTHGTHTQTHGTHTHTRHTHTSSYRV